MAGQNFVVIISENALSHTVENIGHCLLKLDGHGVYSDGRAMKALLSDVLMGIRDDVLLKTDLPRAELEQLLKKELRRDFKHCTIEWTRTPR